jgi:alanine racemase
MGFSYSISSLAGIVEGELTPAAPVDLVFTEILIDSRRLVNPEGTLFVALSTELNDGHKYIGELYERGVRNFLISSSKAPSSIDGEVLRANFVSVSNTLTALQTFAAQHRQRFKIPVLGITGSNGKTVIKEWLFQLMSPEYRIVRSPKSYNSQVGVPLSVMEMAEDHQFAIFEAGISKPGEMEKLAAIIRPTIGLFTNIGQAHGENFTGDDQKAIEKLELFRNADVLIYCKDHQPVHRAVCQSDFCRQKQLITWSRKEPADLFIHIVDSTEGGTTIRGTYKQGEIEVLIPFTDEASIENAIHCMTLLLHLGYSGEDLSHRMAQLEPIAMRLELKEAINQCSLINDSYSLDLNSLRVALDFMNQQKQHQKKTVILSDIFQTGMEPRQLYLEISRLLRGKGVTKLIGIGNELKAHAELFPMEKVFFDTTSDFLNEYPFTSFREETILLKGSRIFEFEKIGIALQQKVHETLLEIDLDAMVHNLNHYRSMLNPGTKTMAMVKAFSYGSGSFEIANLLQFHHVDYLAVAYADEGVELRKAGITLPIMVMNPEEESFDLLLQYDLEPEIYNLRTLDKLEEALVMNSDHIKGRVKIHIKLDSGMHRLGLDPGEVERIVQRIRLNPAIHVQSVFSHLSASEDPAHDDFTREQIRRFREMCDKIVKGIGYPVIRHIMNSAGISRFREEQMEMVRLGIGLYGVGFDDAEQTMLVNVSTLKSTISQIKMVKAGETVGYGRAGKVNEDSIIAIVPIGYADGLNRRLSNGKGKLFINGRPAPIIGNICMDLCMVDITGFYATDGTTPVKEGDEVIIFGKVNPIANLARDLGTIPYEILTGISRRVKRVYFHE